LLVDLQREMGFAYLFISHDLAVVRHISHEIAVMYLGRIVEEGPAEVVYNRPQHPYTKALLSAIPVMAPRPVRNRVILEGDVPSPAHIPPGCRFQTRCPNVMDICREVDPAAATTSEGTMVFCHLHTGAPKKATAQARPRSNLEREGNHERNRSASTIFPS
jgi:oligopeptide/dipeptide ABC transporter ATP-binding protein